MFNLTKKILLASNSIDRRKMVREVFYQLDRSVQLDCISHGHYISYYLERKASERLPGLIVVDDPPAHTSISMLIDEIRSDRVRQRIPIGLFLPPALLQFTERWIPGPDIIAIPVCDVPSECKFYLRRLLDIYAEPGNPLPGNPPAVERVSRN
jgi:hypothetical protein